MESRITELTLLFFAAIFLLTALAGLLQKQWLSPPIVATLLGIAVGAHGLQLLSWQSGSTFEREILLEAARYTLATGVMAVALRVRFPAIRREPRFVVSALTLGMLIMWFTGTALFLLGTGLTLLAAMLLAAIATPTDPVVSTTIVTGSIAKDNIPEHVRQNISAESGANDGLGYPFVMIPILLLTEPSIAAAATQWMIKTILWEVVVASLVGGAMGLLAGAALTTFEKRGWLEYIDIFTYSTALSIAVVSCTHLLEMDGILAVFIAGLAFNWRIPQHEREQQRTAQEAGSKFLLIPFFLVFGASIPWEAWHTLGWAGLGVALAVLLLRRIVDLALLAPLLRARGIESAFYGWFGPVAVAATYYAALAMDKTEVPDIWPWTSLIIALSIVVHGISATPFSRFLGRRVNSKA